MKSRKLCKYYPMIFLLALALSGAGPAGITQEASGIAAVTMETARDSNVVEASNAAEGVEAVELIYESPVFIDGGEDYRPKEVLEKDGKTYELVSVRIKEASREGKMTYVSAIVPGTLEAGEEPPQTAVITIKDETSGEDFEREVPLLEVREKGSDWETGFSFTITMTGYGADSFQLGQTEIPGGAVLSDFGKEFLEYLELPSECYRVETVEWAGEPYENEGILCRDAVARGEKMVRNVEIKYGGQVKTPEIKGKQYVGIYKELVPETETAEPEEPEKTDGTDEREEESVGETEDSSGLQVQTGSFKEQLIQWLKQHLTTITFGGVFFGGIFLTAALLYLSRRKH